MKSIVERTALPAMLALMLTGCGSFDGKSDGPATASDAVPPPAATTPAAAAATRDAPAVIGEPYRVGGMLFTPADIPDYDDVGYAGVAGGNMAGRPTVGGDAFDPGAIVAAHKTLPVPSYAEVTALDTGRTILVRIVDRGPMDSTRLIDLSPAAAAQLGLGEGEHGVRVRRTNPPESERALLRSGKAAGERMATPDGLLDILRTKLSGQGRPTAVAGASVPAPATRASETTPQREDIIGTRGNDRFIVEGPGTVTPTRSTAPKAAPAPTTPQPKAALGDYVVQVAAYGVRSRADAAAKAVGGTVVQGGSVWRVRMGPFTTEKDALAALARAKAKGYRDARVMRDR